MALGQTNDFVWDYSESSDIFNIHRKNIKVEGSAELGDFTIDFGLHGKIIGVEIMNVSGFLKEADVSSEQLQVLQGAELRLIVGKGNITYLWITLMLPQNIQRKIAIPAPVLKVK